MTNRISKLRLESRAASGIAAVVGLGALAPAVVRAIEQVAPPDAVIVLRRVDISLVAHVDDVGRSQLDGELAASIASKILEQLASLRARVTTHSALITSETAFFASRGVYLAEWLMALSQRTPPEWPFEPADEESLWRELVAMDRAEAGTALAHLANTGGASAASPRRGDDLLFGASAPPALLSRAIVTRWTEAHDREAGSLSRATLLGVPAEIIESIWRHSSGPTETDALRRLALLFARWPPARDQAAAAELVTRRPRVNAAEVARSTRRIRTEAAGLALVAHVYGAWLDELVACYDDERARRALRLAVGVALEDARLRLDDPILALFCGEVPDPVGFPLGLLGAFDPEPAHAHALRLVLPKDVELQIARIGTKVLVFHGTLLVDEVEHGSAHEAVSTIVERFVQRVGTAPGSLVVLDRCPAEVIDRLTEVDAPRLPDSWRPVSRCIASFVASRLQEELAMSLRTLRGRGAFLESPRGDSHQLHLDDPNWYQAWPPTVRMTTSHLLMMCRSG